MLLHLKRVAASSSTVQKRKNHSRDSEWEEI